MPLLPQSLTLQGFWGVALPLHHTTLASETPFSPAKNTLAGWSRLLEPVKLQKK
jgi:hypothetical protein